MVSKSKWRNKDAHIHAQRIGGLKINMNILPMPMMIQVKKHPQLAGCIRISNVKGSNSSEYQLVFIQLSHHHHSYRHHPHYRYCGSNGKFISTILFYIQCKGNECVSIKKKYI